jgi:hypothetical protein
MVVTATRNSLRAHELRSTQTERGVQEALNIQDIYTISGPKDLTLSTQSGVITTI